MALARALWPGLIAVAGVAGIGGFMLARRGPDTARTPAAPDSAPAEAVQEALLAARTTGRDGAPITILEIADFQCPACRVFWTETMPLLKREYVDAGKARIVFVNLPIVEIHKNAAAAHEFAMCAALQNRFWPVHDMLYDQQMVWAPLDDPSAYFYSVANATGVAVDSLQACVASGRMRDLIMREAQGVVRAGVQSTPSFVIEGGLLAGAVPMEALRPILDSIYTKKTASR
jgi:protein-disulfide isomerase